jgi:hypothetical protein
VTDAQIDEYRDDASGIVYRNVTPLMTPKLVSNQGLRSTITHGFHSTSTAATCRA